MTTHQLYKRAIVQITAAAATIDELRQQVERHGIRFEELPAVLDLNDTPEELRASLAAVGVFQKDGRLERFYTDHGYFACPVLVSPKGVELVREITRMLVERTRARDPHEDNLVTAGITLELEQRRALEALDRGPA